MIKKPDWGPVEGDVVSNETSTSTHVAFAATSNQKAPVKGLKAGQRIAIRKEGSKKRVYRQVRIDTGRNDAKIYLSDPDWDELGFKAEHDSNTEVKSKLELRPWRVSDGLGNLFSGQTLIVLVPLLIGALAFLPTLVWPVPDTNSANPRQAVVEGDVASLAGGLGNPGILAPLTGSLDTEPPEARGLNSVIRAGPGHVYVSAAAAQAFRAAAKRQRDAAAAIGRRANTVLTSANKELTPSDTTALRSHQQQRNHDHAVLYQAGGGIFLGFMLIYRALKRIYQGTSHSP